MKLKALTVSIILALGASAWAADNSIYIDQAGDSSTITVTQDGSGNRLRGILLNGTEGGNTDPAKLAGNIQEVTIQQYGLGNTLALGLNTSIGSNGKGITFNYNVTDGHNTAIVNSNNNGLGLSAGNVIGLNQSGGYGDIKLNMLGSNNNLAYTSSGGTYNKLNATINANDTNVNLTQGGGGSNETTLNMTANFGSVSLTTLGGSNITSITQSDGGANGPSATMNITGTGNGVTLTQSGLFDHVFNLLATGDNNTINVSQSGGNVIGQTAYLELRATSSGNTIGITQQGSVDNLSNIKLTGSSNTYNILQK